MDRPFDMWDDEGPAIVGLIMNCKTLQALPQAGGVLDQDSLFIHFLNVYENARNEREQLDKRRDQSRARRQGPRY